MLTMPAGDITHPVPDLTGYITEGQVVLAPDIAARGIYPPMDVPSSLSRLMRSGAGKGRTREDHPDVAAQVLAAMARARQTSELAELLGEPALGETDRRYIRYRTLVEKGMFNQGQNETRFPGTLPARQGRAAVNTGGRAARVRTEHRLDMARHGVRMLDLKQRILENEWHGSGSKRNPLVRSGMSWHSRLPLGSTVPRPWTEASGSRQQHRRKRRRSR